MIHIKRHIAKTVTYRILGTLTTMGMAYLFTNDLQISSIIGVGELVFKPVMYFIHERIWYKYIPFGVIRDEEHTT